jgi:DNA-binding winged helix-turn-helix (wHTH) protein/TolB-like protein/Tfp pilus assembly protein PilF
MGYLPGQFYDFGPFRLDSRRHVLLKDGVPIALSSKAIHMLVILVQRDGEVIEKDELMTQVWPDQIVEESNLTVNMSALRKVLGETPNEHRYIATIPGRGYRFIADVGHSSDETQDIIVEEHTSSRLVFESRDEPPGTARRPQTSAEGSARDFDVGAKSKSKIRARVLVALVVILVVAAAAVIYFPRSLTKPVGAGASIKSIAVLPFKPLSADGGEEYLGLGIADTLITKLNGVSQLIVRPTSAVSKYTGTGQDALAAGRELGVESVLEGSTHRSGDRLRVTARLIRVSDGKLLWAGKFDENQTDMFKVEDSISEKVGGALALTLSGEEKRLLSKHYTNDPDAYQAYMIGRYNWNQGTVSGWKKGFEYFNQAIEKDPNFALAHCGLAEIYLDLGADLLSPAEAMPKAKAEAMKAIEIDDTLAEAHTSMGSVKAFYDWDWQAAEEEFKWAIQLNPNSALAHQAYGTFLAPMGRHDESIGEMKRARDLYPFVPATSESLGWGFYFAGRYGEAIAELRGTLEMDANMAEAHQFIGQAYRQQGKYDESIAELQKAVSLSGGEATQKAILATAYAMSGRRAEAKKVLAEVEKLSQQRYVSPYYVAMIYAALGEKEQALAFLERAYGERSRRLVFLKVNPVWDSLRSDPRFADLVRRVGLTP